VRLPVLATVLEAYLFVWRERRDLSILAFPAVAVLAVMGTLAMALASGGEPDTPRGGLGVLLDLAIGALNLGLVVLFSVAWHRKFLVPGEAITVREALRWQRRHTRFLLYALGVVALSWLVILAGSVVPLMMGAAAGGIAPATVLLVLTAIAAALFVYARLSMLFPAAALDRVLGIQQSWLLTARNGVRLALAIVLSSVVYLLAALGLGLALDAAFGDSAVRTSLTVQLIGALVQHGLAFAGLAAGVTVLSIAYRELTRGSARAAPL